MAETTYRWSEIEPILERYGVTYRKWDYWCGKGVLGPELVATQSGVAKDVPWEAVVRACEIGALTQWGVTFEKASSITTFPEGRGGYMSMGRSLFVQFIFQPPEEPSRD